MSSPKLRIDAAAISGVWPILPTPAKENAHEWSAENTVDLDETARVVEQLVASGVNGLMSLGTYGEAHSLTWEEKRDFVACVIDTLAGRIPFFAGTTSLNTRETVRQTRAMHDIGVAGTMLGVPMWCKCDLPTAVAFYRDVTEACPDTAISVYANTEAFKFEFPRPFWAEMGKLPQVVSCKYLGIGMLAVDLELAPRVSFMPHEADYYAAARIAPERVNAFWSSAALCGPAGAIVLRDRVATAKISQDWSKAKEIADEMREADLGLLPQGNFSEFSKYNVGLEKGRMNAAGWMKAGPSRAPYIFVPDEYMEGARRSAKAHAALHSRYAAEAGLQSGQG